VISPILAGSVTAVAYAVSTLGSARSSRLAGAVPAVAGVMLVGTILLLPIALFITPIPTTPAVPASSLIWAIIAGVANVGGLLLAYAAYRIGAVGIVSTIGSTEGAIAAVVSVAAGQALAPGSGPALALVVLGVVLAATSGGHELEEGVAISRAQSLRAAGLSACAAVLLGIGLFIAGQVSTSLPPAWVVLPGRMVGVVLVGIPLLLMGRARVPRAALPFILLTGLAEITGLTSFSVGARQDIAVTSVLGSMFAPMAAIAAFVLFRERLAPRQVAGIGLVVVGIALLGAFAG
jgi:drug/metabolite transporter (DMT)-like permease